MKTFDNRYEPIYKDGIMTETMRIVSGIDTVKRTEGSLLFASNTLETKDKMRKVKKITKLCMIRRINFFRAQYTNKG